MSADILAMLAKRMHLGHCWNKTPDGPRRLDLKFTRQLLFDHVAGHATYGLCPIAPGASTCQVACLDLDSHKGDYSWDAILNDANQIAVSLEMEGLRPHLFRSSGGKGIHIYLTWAAPQDAYSVRETIKAAIHAAGYKSGTKGAKNSELEIFPKQDAVPADGFGSMFILPWAGKSEPLGELYGWADSTDVPVRTREERSASRAAVQALPALGRIRSALDAIPNTGAKELSYDDWRDIIFALHAATGGDDAGLDLAHDFSARSSKYDSDFLNNRVWPYIREDRDGPTITEGTLYARASAQGWEDTSIADDFDAAVPAEAGASADGLQPTPGVGDVRFTFVHESEFASVVPQEMIVQDVLPDADLAVVYGESGSGKSFWTLDLLQAIARGLAWRGKRVKQGRCAYIAAEGAGGFRKRITAYKRENQLDATDLFVLADAPSFLEAAHVKDVIKRLREVGPIAVVVIDTLAQVAPGGAENSSEDMGKIIMHCRMVKKHTGAMVILIHHSGKDAARGARGWSGLKGAVDTEIEIVRAEHDRVATVTKQKDGEDGMEFGFKLRRVDLGVTGHGDAISSCVVDHGAAVAKDKRHTGPKGATEKIVWQVVIDMQALDGSAPLTGHVIDNAITRMLHDPVEGKRDTRRQHALRAIQALVARGLVVLDGQAIRLTEAPGAGLV